MAFDSNVEFNSLNSVEFNSVYIQYIQFNEVYNHIHCKYKKPSFQEIFVIKSGKSIYSFSSESIRSKVS